MDGPITRARSKRFRKKLGERLNYPMEEREEEAKLINFSQLLEYDLFLFFNCIFGLFSEL